MYSVRALLTVFLIAGVLVSGCIDSEGPISDEDPVSDEGPSVKEFGESTQLGNKSITVYDYVVTESYNYTTEDGGEKTETSSKHDKFLFVNLSVTYTGDYPSQASAHIRPVQPDSMSESWPYNHEEVTVQVVDMPLQEFDGARSLEPGDTESGWVTYTIKDAANVEQLKYRHSVTLEEVVYKP